jgi:hypothetical protein
MKFKFFPWDLTPCSLVDRYLTSKEICCVALQGRGAILYAEVESWRFAWFCMCADCDLLTSREEPDFHAGLQGRNVWIVSKFRGEWRTSHTRSLPVLPGHMVLSTGPCCYTWPLGCAREGGNMAVSGSIFIWAGREDW